jgi:hypothetical protein
VSSGGQLVARDGKGVKRGAALACAAGDGVLLGLAGASAGGGAVWFRGGQGRRLRWFSISFQPCQVRGREMVQRSNGRGWLGLLEHAMSTSARLGQAATAKESNADLGMPNVR